MSEKTSEKYAAWRQKAMLGKEGFVFITKHQGRWFYMYKNHDLQILSMKILVDKGSGFEQLTDIDSVNLGSYDCSLVIKDFNKLIFRDADEQLHPYGLKKDKADFKKIILYIKISNITTLIFASAESNTVNVFERCIDSQSDAVISCLFDTPLHSTVTVELSGGEFDEKSAR